MREIKRRKSEKDRREIITIRLPKWLCEEVRARAKRANDMPQSHYVEYVLINAAHPDKSRITTIDALKKINHDQARLGNLLNSGLADPATKSNHEEMEKLLGEIRDTQTALKAKVLVL